MIFRYTLSQLVGLEQQGTMQNAFIGYESTSALVPSHPPTPASSSSSPLPPSAFDQHLHLGPLRAGLTPPMYDPGPETQPTQNYLELGFSPSRSWNSSSYSEDSGLGFGFPLRQQQSPYIPHDESHQQFGVQGFAPDVNMDDTIEADTVALWLQAPAGFGYFALRVLFFFCDANLTLFFRVNDWETYLRSFADGSPEPT